MTHGYSMPLSLLIGVIALCLSVIIPAVIRMTRKPFFTPLQIKAIKLARQLRALAESGRQGCSESDFNLMRIEYEHTFAPQVKALMFEIALGGRDGDSALRRFAEFANNGNDILNLARALIRVAFLQDGIDIDLRYPS